jgi:hypothetical protein
MPQLRKTLKEVIRAAAVFLAAVAWVPSIATWEVDWTQ